MKIKKGYCLEVSTYEGDADYGKEITVDGLTYEQTNALVTLLKQYKKTPSDGGLGNIYCPSWKQLTDIDETLHQVVNMDLTTWSILLGEDACVLSELVDDYSDYLYQTLKQLGLVGMADYHSRYVKSYRVYYVPEDVKFDDVSQKFS